MWTSSRGCWPVCLDCPLALLCVGCAAMSLQQCHQCHKLEVFFYEEWARDFSQQEEMLPFRCPCAPMPAKGHICKPGWDRIMGPYFKNRENKENNVG